MEVMVVSLLGILAFGGAFLLLGPEWWSSSLGTLKDKKHPKTQGQPAAKEPKAPRADE